MFWSAVPRLLLATTCIGVSVCVCVYRNYTDQLLFNAQGRDEAGTSGMTPDKINAQSIIRKLLDKIGQRQMQLDDLWRERKVGSI